METKQSTIGKRTRYIGKDMQCPNLLIKIERDKSINYLVNR